MKPPPGHTVQYTSIQTTSSTTHSSPTLGGKIVADTLLYTSDIFLSATTQPPPTIYTYLMFIILLMSPRTDALHGPRPSYCLLITDCGNSSALQHCSKAPLCKCPGFDNYTQMPAGAAVSAAVLHTHVRRH